MTRQFWRTTTAALIILLWCLGMIWAADYADADTHTTTIEFTGTDFYIPRPATRSDQVGVERLLASVDVPAELVGLTCSVVGTSTNGESVHPNNYGVIRSNGDFVRIDGTEDEASGVKLSDRTIVLGTTVQLFNVMLPDVDGQVATSVDYSVRITCTTGPDDTTTTTTPTTSTSSSTTTSTTQPTATSSTTTPATSTTAPTDSTTTTSPSSSTTSPDGSTSTTAPTGSTSSSTPGTTPPSTLPETGAAGVAGLVGAGLALLLLGFGVLRAGRES